MSVFVILRVPGDPAAFEQYASANGELMRRVAADGQAAGATRHAFAAGDGEILVIDEWPTAEAFQQFFDSQTEVPRIMREGGAQGAPEIMFYRKLATLDEF